MTGAPATTHGLLKNCTYDAADEGIIHRQLKSYQPHRFIAEPCVSSLLSLPPELRIPIYNELILGKAKIKLHKFRIPPVAQTCRLLRNEVLPMVAAFVTGKRWSVQLPPKQLKLGYPFYIVEGSVKRSCKFRSYNFDALDCLKFKFTKTDTLRIRIDNVRILVPQLSVKCNDFVRHDKKCPCAVLKDDKAYIEATKDHAPKIVYLNGMQEGFFPDDFYQSLQEVQRAMLKVIEIISQPDFDGSTLKDVHEIICVYLSHHSGDGQLLPGPP